jgi:hypothetical protein
MASSGAHRDGTGAESPRRWTEENPMRIPYPVLALDDAGQRQWARYFAAGTSGRNRDVEESIWRRSQHPLNAAQSGWDGTGGRRRIVHYRNRYAVAGSHLVLAEWYLYYCLTCPSAEARSYAAQIADWAAAGGWARDGGQSWRRGDVRASLARYAVHPEDVAADRDTPAGFESVEMTFSSDGLRLPPGTARLPWEVLASGLRVPARRGDPVITPTLGPLADYLPFQAELGCGPSTEAGIPPLHRLHEIYSVRPGGKPGSGERFVLSPADDALVREVLAGTERKFAEFTEMYRACFTASPTPALRALRQLADAGYLVGPVITNNFDVLAARAGLTEHCVRRYDEIIPDVPLLPEARSLLVIGSHADRRAVQARARDAGKRVFYLDPEGFRMGGVFMPYPLESPQTGDWVCRQAAAEGLPALAAMLRSARVTPSAPAA